LRFLAALCKRGTDDIRSKRHDAGSTYSTLKPFLCAIERTSPHTAVFFWFDVSVLL
jgi:hypothetical protein